MPSIVSGKPPRNEGLYDCPRCDRRAFVFYADAGIAGKCQECGYEQDDCKPSPPSLAD